MKRCFDLVVTTPTVIILLPLFAAIALLVKLDSPGPVFFRHQRVGRNGRQFAVLKFRSMNAKSASASAGPEITAAGDTRITRIGARLRSSKIDELPQLINVLTGDMSVVGPRPEAPRYVSCWSEHQRQTILSVRPGITDPASVRFRREAEILAEQPDPEYFYRTQILPEKAELYVDYVKTQSFWRDLRIIARTLRTIVKN